nr:hypothetical protein GPVRGNEL_GPVRGNEL_CDS_0003 [Caudoviricetes sp.]
MLNIKKILVLNRHISKKNRIFAPKNSNSNSLFN